MEEKATGMQFANPVLNDYYSKITKELSVDPIERAVISTPEQTVGAIADQVRSYLQPQYDMSVRQRKDQTSQNQAAIDVDAASRGMAPSTWTSDSKSNSMGIPRSETNRCGGSFFVSAYCVA